MSHHKLNFEELFSGFWTFTRQVSHFDVLITGKAFFTKTEDSILYTEDGTYQLHGECQTCFQKHIYKVTAHTFKIFKNDGVLLHEGKIEKSTALPTTLQHQHYCKDDTYNCLWMFHTRNQFETLYTVTGPKKNYQISTLFIRMDNDAPLSK